MSDKLGILNLPVELTTPAGDPLRLILASFLQAAIRYHCGDAWKAIGGHDNDVCARIETNDPSDNTFHTSALPCLALYRDDRNRKVVYLGNDTSYREANLVMLWILPPAVQEHKARRESFFNAVEGAVTVGLTRGRVPTWIVDGDTDPVSQYRGSHIGNLLGLMKPIHHADIRFDDHVITIEMLGAPPRKYPALRGMFTIHEQVILDPSLGTVTAAIAPLINGQSSLSVNGVPWSTLIDPIPT